MTLIATAVVTIPTPARYLVRLAKHFEHRVTVQRDMRSAQIQFPDAPCALNATDTTLDIRIEANSADALTRYEDVVARHLVRVAPEETFDIAWNRSG